jgi:hypothetical protein
MTSQIDMASFIDDAANNELRVEEATPKVGPHRNPSINVLRFRILNSIPFVIPFEDRVKLFRKYVRNDPKRLVNVVGSIYNSILPS